MRRTFHDLKKAAEVRGLDAFLGTHREGSALEQLYSTPRPGAMREGLGKVVDLMEFRKAAVASQGASAEAGK